MTYSHTRVETITPVTAKAYLVRLTGDERRLSVQLVLRLANAMRADQWILPDKPSALSAGLVFDCQGRLLDGQHRLEAVVESGVTVPMYVTYRVSAGGV